MSFSHRCRSQEPDITAHRTVADDFAAALRRDEAEALYDKAPCGYLSVTTDGLILKANQTFLTWTGFERADLVGCAALPELLSAGSKVFYETHLRPLLHMHGQVREIALEVARPDGTLMPVFVNAVMDEGAGEDRLVRVAVFDASERRRYERELLAEKSRAEESERRYAEVARVLQETLMPAKEPRVPGLDVATAYRPAGSGEEIGGDFYDVFEVADGDWVLVIGDVAGKGVEAAVVATLARHTIRALSVTEDVPSEVLRQLNEVILHDLSTRHITVALLRIRRIGSRWNASMSLGGHSPAIVLSADQAPHTIGEPGTLIGLLDDGSYQDVRFDLRPGQTVLLHTDGVTEARAPGRREFYGEDRLMRLLHDNVESAQAVVGRVLTDVLDFQDQVARDDIALLAAQVPADDRRR